MIRGSRIDRFIDEVRSGTVTAEQSLRADLIAARGPLVETIPGTDKVLTTFICIRDVPALSLRTSLAVSAAKVNLDLDVDMDRVSGTNVWYCSIAADARVATSYQFRVPGVPGKELESEYELQHDAAGLAAFAGSMVARGFADPFNPCLLFPTYGVLAGMSPAATRPELWESVLELSRAEPFPHLQETDERGAVTEYRFVSSSLGERRIAVYRPASYDPTRRYPLLLCLDGEHYRHIARLPEILDHAIASSVIPPLVAVFWHNRDSASRNSEMACNSRVEATIADELWPWIDANLAISRDAAERIVTGFSLGGLASLSLGLARPEVFGSVLAVSPSLWFSNDPSGRPRDSLIARYDATKSLPDKVFVAVGSLEVGSLERSGSGATMLQLAREFRGSLERRAQVETHYREEPGGHDYVTVRRATVAGLEALLSPHG